MSQTIFTPTHAARVVIHGSIHGQETVNVLHFARDTPFVVDTVQDDIVALCQAVIDCAISTLLAGVTQNWSLLSVEGQVFHPSLQAPAIVVPQGLNAGALSASSHSFATTIMRLNTASGGRSARGRVFLPPVGEAETTATTIDPAAIAFLILFANCMRDKFTGNNPTSGWRLGVFSRKNYGGLTGNLMAAFKPVTSLVINPVPGLLHSRRPGSGH